MASQTTVETTETVETPHAPGDPDAPYQTVLLGDVIPIPEALSNLTDEEKKALRYQKSPVPRDPNTPISPLDPNDRLRAEGPEVADPATVAAHALFREAVKLGEKAASERKEGDEPSDNPDEGAADEAVADAKADATPKAEATRSKSDGT